MSLISLEFFIFFFIVCAIYFLLPARMQWVWLLITGLFFYYRQSSYTIVGFVSFIVIVLINWAGARFMSDDHPKHKVIYRNILIFDIVTLVVFKYSKFLYLLVLSIGELFGADLTNDICGYIVYYTQENCPQRISYFALIIIAYITDVYWGKSKALNNPGKALLFASYFPLMTSGPIVTFEQMEGQLWGEKHCFSYDRCVRGMERVLWGLFKKMVLSS